ncbi:MAG TPA: GNAT family N-acetyltransferase [Pyrinomonadaceae bacterium]|nr:GNAT family N-acetyltransferase [Pyrinomonadaceae bacterium]
MQDISVKPNMSDCRTEGMTADDWSAVRSIYLEGIATGQATFETAAPSWEMWDAAHLPFARLIARDDRAVIGWAALSPVSRREAYKGVAEVSVYVAENSRGQGVGRTLLDQLIQDSEQNGIWTLQAAVFPENAATLALHKRCGFREVGRRERISTLNNIWRDTVLLERRSETVGVNKSTCVDHRTDV